MILRHIVVMSTTQTNQVLEQIVKILEVVDTREYEEIDDRWVPIRGSGTESFCARCGRPHEVHATVELLDKRTAVVGTGCMKGCSLEKAAKAGASAAKTIAKWECQLADLESKAKKYATISAQVDRIKLPPVEIEDAKGKWGAHWRVSMGDQEMFSRERERKRALKDSERELLRWWRNARMKERGMDYRHRSAGREAKDLKRKLDSKKKSNLSLAEN